MLNYAIIITFLHQLLLNKLNIFLIFLMSKLYLLLTLYNDKLKNVEKNDINILKRQIDKYNIIWVKVIPRIFIGLWLKHSWIIFRHTGSLKLTCNRFVKKMLVLSFFIKFSNSNSNKSFTSTWTWEKLISFLMDPLSTFKRYQKYSKYTDECWECHYTIQSTCN